MHHRLRTAVSRALSVISLVVISSALVAPAADAAERKRVTVKKAAPSATAATKKTADTRRVAAVSRTADRPAKGRTRVAALAAERSSKVQAASRAAIVPAKLSFGQMAGLHEVSDPLDLKSSVALVIDQDTHEVLISKNDHAVLPIASLTKLMTGLIISQAHLPMDEPITITQDDVDTEKGSRSRLSVGTTLTRGEMMHLALMSSENRAAHALGRTYPGGLSAFVGLMNAKARAIGMADTRYVEPTGLSSQNQSSARDLATLVNVAHGDPMLRELSTSPSYEVAVGRKTLQYNNTNGLVKNPTWDIGLQKTGYISEAGRCLVMQAEIAGRKLIMVFLDSAGKFSRLGDAERVRHWVESASSFGGSGSKVVAKGGHG
ncbi:murein-DD-endopeptidase [Acidovorax sp. 56]|uniref:serine hydrolase n=1 Tax=Acidovorax sp. 56 TaxID=2035205 RepID=UPI000C16447A|nr:serine hydrolase [Acidovorax sp. 56]PIF26276.1 murein-DD-endopeptidase [Acidovorax sp. 56]